MQDWRDITLGELVDSSEGDQREATKAAITLAQAAEAILENGELSDGYAAALDDFVDAVDELIDAQQPKELGW